jgi:hypothetical protein
LEISRLFLQNYDPLYNFWLGDLWTTVPADLMRVRPHPRLNSIAWNLWHLTRCEDASINRFVAGLPQVLDTGGAGDAASLDNAGDWTQRMNMPWRHNGNGMTFAEVDELDQRINLEALHGYSNAVCARTRAIVAELHRFDLDATLDEPHLRRVVIEEGLAHPNATGLLQSYLGLTRRKCLFSLGLIHSYQHVGEIDVIASLLGITFD